MSKIGVLTWKSSNSLYLQVISAARPEVSNANTFWNRLLTGALRTVFGLRVCFVWPVKVFEKKIGISCQHLQIRRSHIKKQQQTCISDPLGKPWRSGSYRRRPSSEQLAVPTPPPGVSSDHLPQPMGWPSSLCELAPAAIRAKQLKAYLRAGRRAVRWWLAGFLCSLHCWVFVMMWSMEMIGSISPKSSIKLGCGGDRHAWSHSPSSSLWTNTVWHLRIIQL